MVSTIARLRNNTLSVHRSKRGFLFRLVGVNKWTPSVVRSSRVEIPFVCKELPKEGSGEARNGLPVIYIAGCEGHPE